MIDFATLRPPRSPNWWLCAPTGLCAHASPHVTAPLFEAPAARLAEALLSAADAERGMRLVDEDRAARRFAFEAVSRIMRFVDDVDAVIIAVGPGQSTLALYSRSRVGYSDLGVNRKRGARLLEGTKQRLGASLSG